MNNDLNFFRQVFEPPLRPNLFFPYRKKIDQRKGQKKKKTNKVLARKRLTHYDSENNHPPEEDYPYKFKNFQIQR
ncbi:MAG TPA: hypothetical protein VFK27_04470, partial [Bacillales bacterium]|nr:hypothetical protein [Bacillales bacterium]